MRIYKYSLPVQDEVMLELPVNADILTVQMQAGKPCIWAMVDPSSKSEWRYFRIFGTGHEMKDSDCLLYIGTFQMLDGSLVFDAFEDVTRLVQRENSSEPKPVEENAKA